MKIFLSDDLKAELEHFHDSCRDRCQRDRIKVIILASEEWSSVMTVRADLAIAAEGRWPLHPRLYQ